MKSILQFRGVEKITTQNNKTYYLLHFEGSNGAADEFICSQKFYENNDVCKSLKQGVNYLLDFTSQSRYLLQNIQDYKQ